MAGRTRPLLLVSLIAGLALVLIETFTSSEYTLTLVLGTLFATAIGVSLLMGQSSSTDHASSHLVDRGGTQSHNQSAIREEQNLPDPLELDFDMPL